MNPIYTPLSLLAALTPKDYHLFISHCWDYGDDRNNLVQLIYKGLGRQFFDHAATRDDPIHNTSGLALARALEARIKQSSVLIFPAGVYITHSDWATMEIELAKVLGKPIIAVRKWDSIKSTSLAQQADEQVGWNSNSIANAIKKLHP